MGRIQKRLYNGQDWQGKITLNVKRKMKKIGELSRKCAVGFVGGGDYEVIDGTVGYVGNIDKRECICGAWQVSGIPCKHATAAIRFKRMDPEDFVHDFFSIDMYKKTYSHNMQPIPDKTMWPPLQFETETIHPPTLRRRPGRPKVCRRREANEAGPSTVRKTTGTVKCKRCMQFGHNSRTCQGGNNQQVLSTL